MTLWRTSGGPLLKTSGGGLVKAASSGGGGAAGVLTMSDLTWLGSFRAPIEVSQQGGTDAPLMAIRRVGGTPRIAWVAPQAGGFYVPGGLLETNLPTLGTTYNTVPTATTLYEYGNSWHSLRLLKDNWTASIYNYYLLWDEAAQCYWVQYRGYYNTAAKQDPSLIRITIDDTAHTASATGPYHIGGQIPHRVGGHITLVPSDYATAHLGGRTMAAGNGFDSGGASSPHGDALWAFAPPNGSTPVWPDTTFGLQTATELIGGSITERQRRAGDYVDHYGGGADPSAIAPDSYSGTDLTGYYTAMDNSVQGAACWIDTPTKKGVIFAVNFGRGHIWYQTGGTNCSHGATPVLANQGPVSAFLAADGSNPYGPDYGVQQLQAPAFRIYDPDELMPVSGRAHHQIPVNDWAYLKSAFPTMHLQTSDGIRQDIRSLHFDATDRRLYLCNKVYNDGFTYHWHVNVFQVAD